MVAVQGKNKIWLVLLLLVVGSNIALYNTGLYESLAVEQNPQVVVGSLLDFIIIAPILALLTVRKFSWKAAIGLIAVGCVLSRFVIPSALLAPYELVTTAGIAMELVIIAVELLLLVLFVTYVPRLVRQVKASTEPVLFAWETAVQTVSQNPIVRVFASELIVFYYAFASWRVPKPEGITLYKGTNYMAFQLMLIHGIVLESLGLHWWLHSKAPVLSFILLILNVYGAIFLIADLRATQLNPFKIDARGFYMAQGLMKRTYIEYADIAEVLNETDVKPYKKRCAAFIAPDFETPPAQFILKMKQPQTVHMMYGLKKKYDYIAITCDDAQTLRAAIEDANS